MPLAEGLNSPPWAPGSSFKVAGGAQSDETGGGSIPYGTTRCGQPKVVVHRGIMQWSTWIGLAWRVPHPAPHVHAFYTNTLSHVVHFGYRCFPLASRAAFRVTQHHRREAHPP